MTRADAAAKAEMLLAHSDAALYKLGEAGRLRAYLHLIATADVLVGWAQGVFYSRMILVDRDAAMACRIAIVIAVEQMMVTAVGDGCECIVAQPGKTFEVMQDDAEIGACGLRGIVVREETYADDLTAADLVATTMRVGVSGMGARAVEVQLDGREIQRLVIGRDERLDDIE